MRRHQVRDQRPACGTEQLPLHDVPQTTWSCVSQPCPVEVSDFKWAQGEDLVTFYESTPGIFRGFCRVCGSPIINKFGAGTPIAQRDPKAPSRYGIALATLDEDPRVRPAAHIFVACKAPWYEIIDDLPQYPEGRAT
jgi:hypothetical protein